MLEDIAHKCGVLAIDMKVGGDVLMPAFHGLSYLEHRGHSGRGITIFDPQRKGEPLKTAKSLTDVRELFKIDDERKHREFLEEYSGRSALGHVRYGTSGSGEAMFVQPLEIPNRKLVKWFSLGINGNLVNYVQLKQRLKSGEFVECENDTEVFAAYISIGIDRFEQELQKGGNDARYAFYEIFQDLNEEFDGAYSFAMIDGLGRIVAGRDPLGIRPLNYAENEEMFAVASEDVALIEGLGFDRRDIKVVQPGHIIVYDGNVEVMGRRSSKKALCIFEEIYLKRPDSTTEGTGKNVATFRYNLGKQAALSDPIRKKVESGEMDKDEICVVAVPDTSLYGPAQGYAETLGLRLLPGLVKTREAKRTFLTQEEKRKEESGRKYGVVREIFDGKHVRIIDDSTVRAHTILEEIINKVSRNSSPKSLHLVLLCPQIHNSCYYGIDFHRGELIMYKLLVEKAIREGIIDDLAEIEEGLPKQMHYALKNKEELDKALAEMAGARSGIPISVYHQEIEGLERAIEETYQGSLDAEDFCMACLNGKYPTFEGQKLYHVKLIQHLEAAKQGNSVGQRRDYEDGPNSPIVQLASRTNE